VADITPQAQQFQPFFPGLGSLGENHPALMSLLQLAMQSMTRGTGMAPMGLSEQNMFDRMEQQRLTEQHFHVVGEVAKQDSAQVINAMRGMFHTFGMPFGPKQLQFAQQVASAWSSVAPIFTMVSPDTADALGGRRGLDSVFAHYAEMAGRNRYDPETREIGMSAKNTEKLIKDVTEGMYGGERYLHAPLSAGKAGELFNELQAAGMMPGTSRLEDLRRHKPQQLQALMSEAGVGGRELESLSATERQRLLHAPKVQDELRSFDSKAVIGTLRQWGNAVEAMKEIFGDAGMPNAPMSMVINQLRSFTQGGFRQMDPSQIAMHVRTMRNLMRGAQIGPEGAATLMEQAKAQAMRQGIEPMFAEQAAMDSLAFAQAYKLSGRGGYFGWGQPTEEKLLEERNSLRVSAMSSRMANRIGLLSRLSEEGTFEEGSEAGAMRQAVESGKTSYRYQGQTHNLLDLDENQFVKALSSSSKTLTQGEIQFELQNESANRRPIYERPELLTPVLRSQGQEFFRKIVRPSVAASLGVGLREQLAGTVTASQADDTAVAAAEEISQAVQSSDFRPEFVQDRKARREFLGHRLEQFFQQRAQAGDTVATSILNKFPDVANRHKYFEQRADLAFDRADEEVRRGSQGQQSIWDRIHLHNPELVEDTSRAMVNASSQAELQDALKTVGTGGPLRRFVEAMIRPGKKNIPQIAAETFGGVHGREVLDALNRPASEDDPGFSAQSIADTFKAWQDSQEEYNQANPNDRRDKFNVMTTKAQEFQNVLARLRKQLERSGMARDVTTTPGVVSQAIIDAGTMREALANGTVTDDNREAYKQEIRNVTESLSRDPVTAYRLGPVGIQSVKELERIQSQIDSSGLTEELATNQQRLLSDVKSRTDSEQGGGSADNIQKVEIGRLILKDIDLGSGVLQFSSEDPEGP
jgi:hypothetical protein